MPTAEIYQSARRAGNKWSSLPAAQRLQYLRQIRLEMVDNAAALTEQLQQITGKVALEALSSELLVILDTIRFLERHTARALAPVRVPTPIFLWGRRSTIEYYPRGVVLVISPWNYPLQLSLVPVLTALAAGNAVILKPSEITPGIGEMIRTIAAQAGLPENVVQVIDGDGRVGSALVDGEPDYIFFTGSVATGRLIQKKAAEMLIPTTLELGGKDPMIVCADAALKRAVAGALWGGLTNSGQVCMSVERIYVAESIYPAFVQELTAAAARLKAGGGEQADLGAMIAPGQVRIVRDQVLDALEHGARLVHGTVPEPGQRYLEPMVLVDLQQDMTIMQEETFGPVLCVMPFTSEEEAIRLANSTAFGLNSSVWSVDHTRAQKLARQLIAGSVVINDVIVNLANHHLPYGGEKHSGLGRGHGFEGLRSFSRQTSMMVTRKTSPRELNWFPYQGKLAPLESLVQALYGRRLRLGPLVRSLWLLLRGGPSS